ncbi:hypothetical protein [Sphingobium olei]|uniref:Uncharacterized protein n=1 Tax=Sphingobium olei TaxID=420955 RepID=A0ABW3NZG0_9SPHN
MPVIDYSTTPDSNTSVRGINIAENCAAGNINAAIRAIMADIRLMYNGLPDVSNLVTKTGGQFTGNPIFSGRGGYIYHDASTNASGRIFIQPIGGAVPSGMANGDFLMEY